MYSIVKHIHVILVISSITLFQYRFWRYRAINRTMPKAMKILPHGIDTLLMISGISLVILSGFSPFNSAWLLFKLLALLAYICFGIIAMKQNGPLSWLGYLLASLTVTYMVLAATQKSAVPSFGF